MAEKLSAKIHGISIVSTHIQRELDPETAKVLMTEIMEIIEN